MTDRATPPPMALRLEGVAKHFAPPRKGDAPVRALHGLTLDLPFGRLLGLVGPDGAGKTTLLRILAGLVLADAGHVEVLGQPVGHLDRSLIGYMPQGGALYHELSVAQNLELYARLRGMEPADNPQRIEQIYRLTGLSDFRQREAGRLSGGMRQKLALACAVVAAPPLMLLDEPSVGVDPLSRREIWQLARELAGETSSVVWATSVLDDAERCDDLIVLHEGLVRYSGAARGLAELAQGRTFLRAWPEAGLRAALRDVLEYPAVTAGGIEGGGIRLLARKDMPLPGEGWRQVPARAEDGFASLLDDGKALRPSAIAAAFPDRSTPNRSPPNRSTGDSDGPLIEAHGLTRRYGEFAAAQDISFAIAPGEIFGLLGPNGAGKSTTFRMLCGLLRPSSGSGRVAGHDLQKARAAARQAMGYMPQKFSLYGDLSVRANLRFVAGSYGLPGGEARAAIANAIAALGLEPYADAPSGLLPLGIRQRLSLAAAVLHRPRVLFLDEPTSGVDPLVRHEFWHHINAIAQTGVAVLVTTHFMDEAENCDRVLLINQAMAIAQGTPAQLKQQTATRSLEEAFIALIEGQRAGQVTS